VTLAAARSRGTGRADDRCDVRRAILSALLAAACLPAAAARAGTNYWESVGPDGGLVAILAVDPSTPATVYAGLAGGLCKSTDGGAHWRSLLGLGHAQVVALVIDASSPSVLYAGMRRFGVYKSTDGGATWGAANSGVTAKNGWSLALDPGNPQRVYAGTETGVFRSTDGAATWAAAGTGLPTDTVWALAVDPSSGTVYAGTNSSGVYRSTDHGGTWTAASTGLTPHQVFSLTVDSVHRSTVYAGTAQGVFRSADGGSSWTATGAGGTIFSLAVDPAAPATVYAAVADSGVLRSDDGGLTWGSASSGLPGDGVNALAIDPSATGTIYAGVLRGVFKSTDHGNDWTASYTGMRALTPLALAVDPSTPTTVYAGTNAGLYVSIDEGVTWIHPISGLDEGHVNALLIVPGSPGRIVAGTNAGAFLSTDSGTTWVSMLSAGAVFALASDPSAPSTLYAGGATNDSTPAGFVYRSTDGGATWASYGSASPALPPVDSLAVPPAGGPVAVYAGTDSGGYGALVQGGAVNWASSNALSGRTIFSIAIDPAAASTLYVGTDAGLRKSEDGGNSFQTIDPTASGLQAQQIFALLFDPSAPGTLYAGTATGFYVSTDGGAHWTGLYDGVGATRILSIAAGPTPILYAGANGASVYQYGKPDLTPCFSGPFALCLNGGRFRVTASWQTTDGRSGAGMRVALSGDTGYFWFFSSDNVELVVKVLDGTGVNGHFWVFYGALSDVQYTITIRDTHTGVVKTWANPQGHLASVADTTAFAPTSAAMAPAAVSRGAPAVAKAAPSPGSACASDPTALCLNASRFQVEVSWRTADGRSGSGQAVGLTDDTGYFWFFSNANVELIVKVLDGRAVNGHFWVFYGALSDVQYTLTVTDTQTGTSKPYVNPQGTLASEADTAAF
jgi:photosystem II stability/assembly factor-like uncharacterized protein